MARRTPPTWIVATTGLLIGALVGAGAVYAVQQQRLADVRAQVAGLKETVTRSEADKRAALERLAEAEQGAAEPTPVPEPAPVEPEDTNSPATPLPSSQFAFVERLTFGRPGTIVLDYAEYLTGTKAAAAAKAHGDESPPPNDYYIVNDNAKLRTFKIAPDAEVRLVTSADGTSDPAGYTTTVERWAGYFAAGGDETAAIRSAGYWVVIDDGVVTAVREQFAP